MSTVTASLQEIRDFKGRYPRQLWFLFLSEMWERFCFYGMRGVLTIFMIEQLGMAKADANLRYGAIQAFVYTMTFVGGFFADKILGFRKSIFWGGLLMIVGSFTIAFAPGDLFYIGTSISIVGTGFFKPNISGVVGLLYNDGDKRRDAGFGLFYTGINIGAALGGWLCFRLGNAYGWEWSFIAAGIAMMLGLLIFGLGMNSLGPLGFSPLAGRTGIAPATASWAQIGTYVGSLLMIPFILMLVSNSAYTDLFMYIVGPIALAYLFFEMRAFRDAEGEQGAGQPLLFTAVLTLLSGLLLVLRTIGISIPETLQQLLLAAAVACLIWSMVKGNSVQRKLHAALIFILFSVLFWAFFEQSGGSLAIVAREHVTHDIAGVPLDPNEVNNSSNAIFVIMLSWAFGLLWLWLSKRRAEPNTVVKFGLGFIFLAAAFYLFHSLILHSNGAGITPLSVFTLAYLVITIGELCLSPIGLSAMTKLSPKRLFGIIMGLWFLASAYGQYIAGLLGAGMATTGEYTVQMATTLDGSSSVTWQLQEDPGRTFEKMDIVVSSTEADTAKLAWTADPSTPHTLTKYNANGEVVAWMVTEIPNNGAANVTAPLALTERGDITTSVAPRSIERLQCYTDGYLRLALYALICGILLVAISPWVRKLMGEVK